MCVTGTGNLFALNRIDKIHVQKNNFYKISLNCFEVVYYLT